MTNAIVTQNNENLIDKLKNSYLSDENKGRIEPLIPRMNDEERTGLLELIEESNQLEASIVIDKTERITKLNEEFTKKSDKLLRDLPRQALKKMEGASKENDEMAMSDLDSELDNL